MENKPKHDFTNFKALIVFWSDSELHKYWIKVLYAMSNNQTPWMHSLWTGAMELVESEFLLRKK